MCDLRTRHFGRLDGKPGASQPTWLQMQAKTDLYLAPRHPQSQLYGPIRCSPVPNHTEYVPTAERQQSIRQELTLSRTLYMLLD